MHTNAETLNSNIFMFANKIELEGAVYRMESLFLQVSRSLRSLRFPSHRYHMPPAFLPLRKVWP